MFKKVISIFLSIAMFLSATLVNIELNKKEVFAGTKIPTFNSSFTSSLSEGYNNGVPIYSSLNPNSESSLFTFSMDKDPNNAAFVQGTYVLTYPLKDNTALKMTVDKDSATTATVTYDFINTTTGASINYTETATKADFTIFSYSSGTYQNHSSFNSNGTVASGNYVVSKKVFNTVDARDANGSPNKPVFHITSGSGFSFEYGGVYAHIKWDDLTNQFQFYTDSLYNGYVYDVNLNYTSFDLLTVVDDSLSIFTGMSVSKGTYQGNGKISDKFIAAPFANDDHFEKDVVYSSSNETPGDQVNGIRFGLTAPLTWDPTTNKYSKILDSTKYDMNLVMEMAGRQIKLNDILTPAFNVSVSGSSATSYTAEVVQTIDSKGQFYFDLKNLPIGIIYDHVKIQPQILDKGTTTSAVLYNETEIPYGDIFTFPNYSVVQINSQYYVELEPFKTYDGKSLISGTYLLKTNGNPSVTQASDGSSKVYFPLPLSSSDSVGAEYVYQIFFNPITFFPNINDVKFTEYMHSEQYSFKVPAEKGDIKLPENFIINDYSLSAKPGVDKKTEMVLSLDMSYDIATKTQLDKMYSDSKTGEVNIKYVLENYLSPTATDINREKYTYVNLKIYKGDYTDPTSGVTTTNTYLVDYTFSYNQDMSNPYKTITGELFKSEFKSDSATDVYYADFNFDVRASRDDANPANPTNPPIYFEYPNIYFMTVNAVTIDRGDGLGEVTATGGSTFQSITLNDVTDKEVPPPQSLEIDNITKKSFDVTWRLSGDGLTNYLAEIYTSEILSDISANIGQTASKNNLDAYYNIYIGTNESFMNDTFSNYSLPDSANTTTPTRTGYSYYIDASNLSNPYNLYVSDYTTTDNSGNEVSYAADTNGSSSKPIDTLRETRGVVMVGHYPIYNNTLSTSDYNKDTYTALQNIYDNQTNIDNMLSIYGLDKNKKYYVFADLVIENQETSTMRVVSSSKLAPLAGATTLSDLDVPEDNDKVPPSPALTVKNTSVDSVELNWPPIVVTDSQGKNSQIEYNVIRLQGAQLPDKYLYTKDPFTYTWENYIPSNVTDKKGYKTNITVPDDNLLAYSESTKTFASTDDATLDSTILSFVDNGLTPNKVYFYYVRSIRVTKDANGNEVYTYSNWTKISATTKNVTSPTNLIINTAYKNYDPETEVVLNFDAPIIDTSKIGVAYDLYYSIREDGGNWSDPILMDAKSLINGATGTTDTSTNFNYIVSKLKKGTSYTFKVKMVDKSNGASSLYSNEARAKTDLDQDEYDNNNEIGSWEDFILDKLKEMMNGYYWIIKDTYGQRDIVYKEDKFAGLISSTTDSFITLLTAKDTAINNYYISANSYQQLCDKGMGLKIVYKNTEFYLTPKALTDALNAAKKDVASKNISDYYIKITVSGYVSGAINGETCLSDIVTIDLATNGFEKTVKFFENQAYNQMLSSLLDNDKIKELYADIADYVKKGKSDLEIQELVLDAMPDLEDDVLDEIQILFSDYLAGTKYNSSISKLDNQMTISLLNADPSANVNGYHRVNENWVLQNVIAFGTSRTFKTLETGIFVFTGKVLILPGIDSLTYGNIVKNLFIKYGLDEYLGSGSTFNADQKITGQMAMGSVAKMMGMTSLQDPVAFLKAKNIVASERVSRNNLKAGDMVYYLMKLYEHKTGTSIENLNITNYAATSKMQGLNSQNKKSIQIGTQIGLVRDPNFNANYEVTVKDFLYYLNRLNELTSL